MSLEYFFPITESHAIQTVVFALEWQGDLSDPALMEIKKLDTKLKKYFPISSTLKMVKIRIGAMPNDENIGGEKSSEDQIGGISFQRTSTFGSVVSQLIISRNNCVVVINDYVRWSDTLRAAIEYFEILLPVILKEKSINMVSLQYVDVFTWKDDPSNLNLKEVFNDGNKYMASNVFTQKGLWHSHHGYWVDDLNAVDGKCLDNINVSTIDNVNDRCIHILTTHQFVLDTPLRVSTKDYMKTIENIQNALHDHNKDVLTGLLTSEVCAKINLHS